MPSTNPARNNASSLPQYDVGADLPDEYLSNDREAPNEWVHDDFAPESEYSGWDQPGTFYSDDTCAACPDECGTPWYIDFWLAHGFTANPDDPESGLNTPQTFNDQANDYQLNQLYLALGRGCKTCGPGFDWGARADLLFGTDYYFTQSLGLETRTDGSPRWNSSDGPRGSGADFYGLAMPQLYAEAYVPILNGINVKVGHFYSTIGYESVMAPENFFYSHSYAMQYGEPFTHTGVLSSFSFTNNLHGHFGYTRGWNTWEDPNDKPGYLFGLCWTPSDVASIAATGHVGKEDIEGKNDRSLFSIVFTRQLTTRMRYVFQYDFGSESNAEIAGPPNPGPDSAKWYGSNHYLFYDVADCLTAGWRFEWFKDQDNARVLGIPSETLVEGNNYFQFTAGLNWIASRRITFRPELRWDWSDVAASGLGGRGMFDDFKQKNQFTAAMDIIFRF